MRRATTTTMLLILSSCSSMPWNHDAARPVDAGLLVYVPESEKQGIQEARATRAQVSEDLAVAQRDAEQAASRLDIAKNDAGVIEDRVDEAQDQVDHAKAYGTQDALAAAQQNLADTQAAARLARTRVDYYEDLETLADRMVDLEQARLDLATARVNLSEAQAISRLDRPATQDVDVASYRETVRQLEDEVATAQVEARAARTRVDLRHDLLANRAQAVPASFRTNEPEPADDVLSLELLGDESSWEGDRDRSIDSTRKGSATQNESMQNGTKEGAKP